VVVDEFTRVGRVLERPRLEPVRKREFRRPLDVGLDDLRAPVEGGERPGGARRRDVAPVSIDARVAAQFRDITDELRREFDPGEPGPGPPQSVPGLLSLRAFAGRSLRSVAVGSSERPVDDADPSVQVLTAGDGRLERKAVPELRSELSLLGVHRPHEREPGGVGDAHAVAFDPVDPARRRIEQHVDEVVVEEVHLVDVEDTAVRPGEQSGVELELAAERVRHGERPDDPLAGRPERERDERNRSFGRRRVGPLAAVLAPAFGRVRRAAVRTVLDGILRRKEVRQRPDCRGLRRSLLALHEKPVQVVVRRDSQ